MAVFCLRVCIILHSVSVVARCDLLVTTTTTTTTTTTGDMVILLVTMEDMSRRIICSLFIDSSFVVVLNFSVIVFVYVISSAPLVVAISL